MGAALKIHSNDNFDNKIDTKFTVRFMANILISKILCRCRIYGHDYFKDKVKL